MNKKLFLYILILICSLISVSATTYLYENTTYTPGKSNVTYRIVFPVIQCDNFTINDTCFIIYGGLYTGEYCNISSTPIIINLTASFPNINIVFPENNIRYNKTIDELNYTVSGANLDKCWYYTVSSGVNSSVVEYGINFTSVPYVEGNNTWTVYCNNSLNTIRGKTITFEVAINPKLSLQSPINKTYGNETVNFIIHADENLSVCWFNYTGSNRNYYMNNVNSSTFNYSNSSMIEGFYETFFRCNDSFGYSNNSIKINFSVERTPPIFSNYKDTETDVFPERGNLFRMNVTINDSHIIDRCKLYVNDSLSIGWRNTFNYSINIPFGYLLYLNYSVTTSYPDSDPIYWKVWCIDNLNNSNYSLIQNFTIKDISNPLIIINQNTTFKTDNSSIITFSQRNLDINITYNDTSLHRIYVNITCDISNQQHYFNITLNQTNYNYTNTVNFGSAPLQRCIFVTNATDWDGKSTQRSYMFWIGGTLNLSATNIYDDTLFKDYDITVRPKFFQNSVNGTFPINVTSGGIVENLTNGSYRIFFTDACFFSKEFNITFENLTQVLNYTSWQSTVTFRARNIKTLTYLNNITVNLTNTVSGQSNINNSGTDVITTFYVDASTYDYVLTRPLYEKYSETKTLTCGENIVIVDLNFNATFNLIDEKSFLPFNITEYDEVTFYLFCENYTYTMNVPNSSFTIPINCTYSKFRFDVNYLLSADEYQRTYILFPSSDISQVFNVSIYLMDIKTTLYVKNFLYLDDLLETYDKPAIFVYKQIPIGRVQITADFVDITNKIIAYLVQNDEYIIELHSLNKPLRILGNYGATDKEDQVIRLYDINIPTTMSGPKNNIYVGIGKKNDSGIVKAIATYEDLEETTISVTFQVRQNIETGPLLYATTSINQSNIEFEYDITGNLSDILYGRLLYTYVDSDTGLTQTVDTYRIINEVDDWIFDPLRQGHISKDFMNWFITLFLGMLAIFATIKSANPISLILIGLAALLISVKLYTLSWGIIGLSAMVALLYFLKKGESET